MEASASDKTEQSRAQSSAGAAADAEVFAAAGAFRFLCRQRGATSSAADATLAMMTPASRTAGPSSDPVARLPAALSQRIFLLVPAHDRMRCRAVSRAWRAALADRGCWRILRFAGSEDLPRVRRSDPGALSNFILAAGRAAGGAAEEIDARGVNLYDDAVIVDSLKRLVDESCGSLRVVRLSGTCRYMTAADVAAGSWVASLANPTAFPHLEELEVDVRADSVSEARRLLDDARPPGGRLKALRIRTLNLRDGDVDDDGEQYYSPEEQREEAESLADVLRTAVAGHPSLTGLTLHNMQLHHSGPVDAVADCGLESLRLVGPHIDHTCLLPALSRALRSGRLRLRSLEVSHQVWSAFGSSGGAHLLDGPRDTHEEFCAALRGSRLEELQLVGMRLWANPDNGRALLAALTAHPTLRRLDISWNIDSRAEASEAAAATAAAAEAIAALLGANAPALKSLYIDNCGLDNQRHFERILVALRGNAAHITTLEYCDGPPDEAFARREVLQLLQANAARCGGR